MPKGNNTKKGGAQAPLDATRTAESVPLATSEPAGMGGSSLGQLPELVTEASFLQPERLTLIDSPFGHRYAVSKSRSRSRDDIAVRVMVFASDVKGYHDVGTLVNYPFVDDLESGHILLQDWYQLVRDMGKRALKYKHIPTTITDVEIPRHYMNAHHFVGSNLWMLINLNRLGMFNVALATLFTHLPKYMSRILRAWKRLSAAPAPNWLKAKEIRDGSILHIPGLIAPTMRFWHPLTLLAAGSGGPSVGADVSNAYDMLANETKLGVFVLALENTILWLERGTPTIEDDFRAFKDVVDMTHDVAPGTWTTGLVEAKQAPGFVASASLYMELFGRAIFAKDKVTAGTDQWQIFPIPGLTTWGSSNIPINYLGNALAEHDVTLMGTPKFGFFDDDKTAMQADVNSITRVCGTDVRMRAYPLLGGLTAADIFGTDIVDEVIMRDTVAAASLATNGTCNWGDADVTRAWLQADSIDSNHYWMRFRAQGRDSFPAGVWSRFVDESRAKTAFVDVDDLGFNYGNWMSKQLAIPFLRG